MFEAARRIRRDHRRAALVAWRSAVRGLGEFRLEIPLVGAGGGCRWHLLEARPVKSVGSDFPRWCVVCTDVHDQRVANDTLLEQRRVRDEFVGTLVHDLRNAFGTGRVAMQMLLDGNPDREERGHLESIVLRAFTRVDRMAEDLLDVKRIEAGQPMPLTRIEAFDLAASAREVAGPLARTHGRRIVTTPVTVPVRWSAKEITRVLENLFGNAIKYGDPDREITFDARADAGVVEWSVHNWGEPLETAEHDALFTFLGRSGGARSRATRGWGIGLTLVKAIVEAHGGSVRVESDPIEGTRFVMTMPMIAP